MYSLENVNCWRTQGYEGAATIMMRLGAQDVANTGLDDSRSPR